MLDKRRKPSAVYYDKSEKIPVIRSSICTGEKVAGFKNICSGKFEDIMLIRNKEDLSEFLEQYHVDEKDIKWEY